MNEGIFACRRHFLNAALFSALLNLTMLAPTLYMLQVYDRVVPTRGFGTLLWLTGIFTFSILTLSALDFVRSRLLIRAASRLDRLLGPRLLRLLLSHRGSARNSAALREFDALRQTVSGPAVIAIFDAPWTPIYVAICFLIHPALGVLSLLGALLLAGMAWLSEAATRNQIAKSIELSTKSYVAIDQSMAAAPVLHALGMAPALLARRLAERTQASFASADANFTASTYTAISKFVRVMLQSLALGVGAWLAIDQKISAGGIFAASLLVGRALSPIEMLVQTWRSLLQGRLAYRKLDGLLREEQKEGPITILPQFAGALILERVQLLTPERDRLLLGDITFELKAGEALGVIGASGAGKSTLVRIIAGAQSPDAGMVRFDGADRKDWNHEHLSARIGYAPQDPCLFAGTVKENIARFATELAGDDREIDEAVVKAALTVGAHQMILNLPKGYDTELAWGGGGLSAGQAQRISLARAFYGDPALILLDEPNAHLDGDSESALIRGLSAAKARGATIIIAAHRSAVLRDVDKLLVLADGRIALSGPREDVATTLLARQKGTEPRGPMSAPIAVRVSAA